MTPALPPSVKSADRTVGIIEHVARSPGPVGAQQIADTLGIPASSLSYLLGTLVDRGWLQVQGRRAYVIGPTLRALLGPVGQPLADRAAPIVRRIRHQLNETCGYFERSGHDLVAVVSETGQQALSYTMTIGQRGPLHAFAAGKAMLAMLPREALEAYLAERPLARFTPYTLTSRSALRRDLALVRQRGHALTEHEHTLGLVSVAVPVGDPAGDGFGAISVAVPSVRFDDALKDRALGLLDQAARQLGSA
ncbi:MAG: IclR family transcriptional regulator [Sphingomonas fennica]